MTFCTCRAARARVSVTFEPLRRTLTNPTTWVATAHSLVTAVGGTFLAVVIGGTSAEFALNTSSIWIA